MIRCVFYLRLSREDGNGESDSIQNQRSILQRYLAEHEDMIVVGEWVDDGWSGSNYERPGFQKMMEKAVTGDFQCILCKDLSRLGREYIQTGYYLRKIFPEMGIRFIAVADNYDSAKSGFMEDSLLLPVMNLMNDAYCRDISNKVRLQQKTKREMGEYIGAFTCYGYRKSGKDIHRLEIDPPAAEIVRIIFYLRISGMAAENIAKVLNMGQIFSPYMYKKLTGSGYCCGFIAGGRDDCQKQKYLWSPQAVRRILSNQMYTGVMIQGKDRKISYKLKRRVPVPRAEWCMAENAVPKIISKWIYGFVQGLNKKRIRSRKGRDFCDMFAGYGLSLGQQKICEKIWRAWEGEKAVKKERWMARMQAATIIKNIIFYDKEIYVDFHITAPFREE